MQHVRRRPAHTRLASAHEPDESEVMDGTHASNSSLLAHSLCFRTQILGTTNLGENSPNEYFVLRASEHQTSYIQPQTLDSLQQGYLWMLDVGCRMLDVEVFAQKGRAGFNTC